MFYNLTAPYIETDRLILRVVDMEDAKAYFIFCSQKEVCRYLTFNPYQDFNQAKNSIQNMIRSYLQGSDVNFSILLKKSKLVIGSISLSFKKEYNLAEIGYILNYDYWRQGLMSEAIKALIKASFEYYHLDGLYANYIEENENSAHLLMKNNFKIIQIEKQGFIKNGTPYNLVKTFLPKS